jgi:hypothetical protein
VYVRLLSAVAFATCVAACGLDASGQGAPGVDDAGSPVAPLSPLPVQPPSAGDDSDAGAPLAPSSDDAGSPGFTGAMDSGDEGPTDSGVDATTTHTPPPPPPPPPVFSWDGGWDGGQRDGGFGRGPGPIGGGPG